MDTIIFNTDTGDIIAVVVVGQDLDSVRSNWTNVPINIIQVDPGFKLFDKNKRVQYKINPQTKELILI